MLAIGRRCGTSLDSCISYSIEYNFNTCSCKEVVDYNVLASDKMHSIMSARRHDT